jgi:hypothetical protein
MMNKDGLESRNEKELIVCMCEKLVDKKQWTIWKNQGKMKDGVMMSEKGDNEDSQVEEIERKSASVGRIQYWGNVQRRNEEDRTWKRFLPCILQDGAAPGVVKERYMHQPETYLRRIETYEWN